LNQVDLLLFDPRIRGGEGGRKRFVLTLDGQGKCGGNPARGSQFSGREIAVGDHL
jgi:hypothetical protein